jgi:hypothetical protein
MSYMSPLKKVDKSERMNFRLTPAELSMLNDLCDLTGLSASDVLRQLIRQEHAAKCPVPPPMSPKPTKKRKS